MVETVTLLISLGAIGLQVAIVIGCLLLVLKKGGVLLAWFGKRGVLFAYLLALAGMIGSLFYSEVALFTPCVLCWYQRIFVYANVFILGLALYRGDNSVIPYGKILSIVGGVIAFYHVILPSLPAVAATTCSPASSVSCSETYFTTFGYITIPIISLTSFVAMWFLLHLAQRYVSNK